MLRLIRNVVVVVVGVVVVVISWPLLFWLGPTPQPDLGPDDPGHDVDVTRD